VNEAFPEQKYNPHALIEGHWDCPDEDSIHPGNPSPTGKCIYIAGGSENCVFCGSPAERK
jgi:hypothetical protein